ncbi:MAG: hypothetical protein Q4D58_09745 [Synergistaceae bacterium]|nr:hypothetical protein [Synergistaceae bacterium]
MMKAGDVMTRTRLYARDMQGERFSDFEVFAAINDAVRLLAEEELRVFSGADFRRSCDLDTATAGYALLPEGFLREIRAFDGVDGNELLRVHSDEPGDGEYAIREGVLHSGCDKVTLCYYGLPAEVRAPDDDLRLSEKTLPAVAKMAAAMLSGGDAAAVQTALYFTGQSAEAASSGGEQRDSG